MSEDDQKLLKTLKQSVMSFGSGKADVKFDDIVGLQLVKDALNDCVIIPIQMREMMNDLEPWKAILLFGPPGTGKTDIARACANEVNSRFFSVTSSSFASKWHGDSERMVKLLFDLARYEAPSIIFIDEVEWLCSGRSSGSSESSGRLKSELLAQMEGTCGDNTNILILAATNKPEMLDEAFRRRFEQRIYVPLPSQEARKIMFEKKMETSLHMLKEQDFQDLAERTVGYSGADIKVVVRYARMEPLRRVQKATHFKEIEDGFFTVAAEDENGAEEKNFLDIEKGKCVPPPVTMVSYFT